MFYGRSALLSFASKFLAIQGFSGRFDTFAIHSVLVRNVLIYIRQKADYSKIIIPLME